MGETIVSTDPRPTGRRRTWLIAVVGLIYALGAAAILFWPTTLTDAFRAQLDAVGELIPYGDKLLEAGANVLLFVPAGWLAGSLLPRGKRWLGLIGGVMVSSGVELTQAVLLPGRVPSPRDILANSLGVALGVLLAAVTEGRRVARHGPDPMEAVEPPLKKPRPRWMRILGWTGAGILAIGLGLGAWVGLDALRARDALAEIADVVPELVRQVRENPGEATGTVHLIESAAANAQRATSGPHWTMVGWLPWIGENTRALQAVTHSVHTLAAEGLPGLAAAAETLSGERLAPRDGRIDTTALVEVRPAVTAGSAAVTRAHLEVAGIDRGPLIPPLAEAVARLTKVLAEADDLASSAAVAVQLIPSLLGADAPRDWLVLAQNNAELRATGGIPGATVLMRADAGELTITDQRGSGDFGPYRSPVLPLTEAEQVLFGPELGLFIQDVNLTPDFPRSAELAVTMWQRETGESPAGVLSVDPVALATFLTATGPVEFQDPFGHPLTLTAEDAASFLMSGIYARYERGDVQDQVFALASQAVLKQLMSSQTDPQALIRAVTESIAQHRLLLWSERPDEQALLEQAGASGGLQAPDHGRDIGPQIGVFLNLTTPSKTGYYLDSTAELADQAIQPDGSRHYALRMRLTSLLQPGQADTLPEYVKWGNRDGVLRVNVLAYAPTGGSVVPDPAEWPGFVTVHDGLQVSALTVKVPATETVELTWRITTGPDQPLPAVLRVTPGARNP